MTEKRIVDGEIVYEVTESEFKSGLLQLVDGNAVEAVKLFQEYRSVLNDEITKAKQAKSQGKPENK